MYYVLNADYLLAAVLARRNSISFDALDELRRNIESSCPGVAVDISSTAIECAIESYPAIFERRPDGIVRAVDAERYLCSDYLKYKFTNRVPMEIRQTVLDKIA
jgi:hypothetical protein